MSERQDEAPAARAIAEPKVQLVADGLPDSGERHNRPHPALRCSPWRREQSSDSLAFKLAGHF